MRASRRTKAMRALATLTVVVWGMPARPAAQAIPPAQAPRDTVLAIQAPREPLPPENASRNVNRFSFLVYGDTRGRRDGVDPQYEHSLIVEAMLRTIAALRAGPDPVRFILQSGDAVVDGRQAAQWNRSFTGLINRLTTEGGIPYFMAPGNHDVTPAPSPEAPVRQGALQNYLDAVAQLVPPAGASRRLAGYPTYAFGYGNTFVLAFDSNIAGDSTQFAWVEAQLAGLDRRRYANVVALFHHPPYSSGPHGGAVVEPSAAALRERYMPLFRRYGVRLLLAGHEHVFEHWVERYRDSLGRPRRLDAIVTGGGGAPPYFYRGEPDLRAYTAGAGRDSVRIEHVVRPGPAPGDNPYHYVIVHVDGSSLWLEVVGVDWGRGFQPYRSARATLAEP